MNKQLIHRFVITTFVSLYFIVSFFSTYHVITFFSLSNPMWVSVGLAIAFEIGAAASLAALTILEKLNKNLVLGLFILLTLMQMMGNMFYAYINLENFQPWSELFFMSNEPLITQKQLLSFISGAILPLIALGFIKSLVDYINPNSKKNTNIVYDNGHDEILDNKENTKEIKHSPEIKNKIIEDPPVIQNTEVKKEKQSNQIHPQVTPGI